jgi:acyl-CoA hydrolase/RimJ/RimL family protein N-acetyltransferase
MKDDHASEDSLRSGLKDKQTTADEAMEVVQSGDRIFVGTACATPRTLIRALEARSRFLFDVQLYHFLTDGAIPQIDGKPQTGFKHKVFYVGFDTRDAIKEGMADYIPISLAQLPGMILNNQLNIDVALIQVSPPDDHGFVSLGISVDITRYLARHAKKIIAEINPNMPRTQGDSFIAVDQIDYLVWVDEPVTEYLHPPADTVAEQIARYVARIIDDGATLQIGLGRIPNEMLKYLTERRDLGIHSDVITEPIIELIEKGIVTGRKKTIHWGQVVTSYCMGTKRLYQLIDQNPMFSFHPIDYVCNPAILSRNNQLTSVTQAFAIDITGQICADQFNGEFYGGVSTQPDFMRAAAASPGGKSIICLPSTTDDGQTSRIRPLLLEGEGVTIARSDVHYVITEYGMAYLFGKTIRERALSLIEIAHPSFRDRLLEEARRLGYVRSDQKLRSKAAYPAEEERRMVLKNGAPVMLRPAKASDVEGLQDIFYRSTPDDIYTRFFNRLKSLSVSKAAHLCNVDYENEMAFVAVAGDRENEQIIATSCYFVDHSTNLGEVAYMILPEWQSIGVGSAMQQRMIEYAKSKGVSGFKADVLAQNEKMLKVIQQGENVSLKKQLSYGTCEVTMMFNRD